MWVIFAFISAFFIGCYDICKKISATGNAILPVLLFNGLICCLLLSPLVLVSRFFPTTLSSSIFYVSPISWHAHVDIVGKAFILLVSRFFTYMAMKHLPLTITGQINSTRPIVTLLGSILIFGEELNLFQWWGVIITILAFLFLMRSGKKEGISFRENKWIIFMILGVIASSGSSWFDKFLMYHYAPTSVQFWCMLYQSFLILIILIVYASFRRRSILYSFKWNWSILLLALFLTISDFLYFYALKDHGSMLSIVTMIRRGGGVIISFIGGALIFHEKNLRRKAIILVLLIIAMFFLYLGSK